MKCKECNSDVLKSFLFCHNCGNVLDADLQKKDKSNVVSSVSSHVTAAVRQFGPPFRSFSLHDFIDAATASRL